MSSMTRPDSLFVGPQGDDDRYELLRACGEGGEGQVYEGQLLVEGHPQAVAIKMSRRGQKEPEPAFAARAEAWQAQIRIVQSIRHTSIVGMRETFIGLTPHRLLERPASQAIYLAMHWVEGPNLSTWAADHPERNFRIIKDILISVAAGLSHLHTGVDTGGRAIFHRDVKPSNVIIADDGKVVLVDFGLALGEARMPTGGGTPGYIAPEVRRSGAFSAASDLYGLAAIAFFLITGRHPSDEDTIERFRRDLDAAPFVAHLPLLGDVVLAGLQPEPSDRPTSVAAWARQLEGAGSTTPYPGGDLPPPAPNVPAPPTPPVVREHELRRPHRGRRNLAVFAALATLLGAFLLSRQSGGGESGNLDAAAPTTQPDTTLPPTTSTSSTSTSTSSTSTTVPPTTTTVATAAAAPPVMRLGIPSPSSEDSNDPTILRPAGLGGNTWAFAPNTINGTAYDRVLGMGWCSGCLDGSTTSGYIEYNLTREFKRMTATVGQLDKSNQATGTFRFEVIADGVQRSSVTLPFGKSAPVDLDVTGVLRLRLTVTRTSSPVNAITGWGDPKITRA